MKLNDKMKSNIGEAILILGCIYFILNYNLGWWVTGLFILIGFALFTWAKVYHPKEFTELTKIQIQKMKLEIELMKAQTQFYVARGAAIIRGLKV